MYYISDPTTQLEVTHESPNIIKGSLEEEASSLIVFQSHNPSMGFNISSPSCSPALGDYIGSESCVDLQHGNGDDFQVENGASLNSSVHHSKRVKHCGDDRIKEFPPPMTLPVRTENLPSHMPWVLRRNYTSDGRLVLTEEKVRHHEYFRAYRGDGRLTLQLITLHDDEEDNFLDNVGLDKDDQAPVTNEEEDIDEKDIVFDGVRINKMKDGLRQIVVDELALHKSATLESESSVTMGSSGTPKCLNLNMASAPSSLFSLPVPATS